MKLYQTSKYLFNFICVLSISIEVCHAQNNSDIYQKIQADSLHKSAFTDASLRNPALRFVHISTDLISSGDILSTLNGKPLLNGNAKTVRTGIVLNLPVTNWGKNSLTASLSYFNQSLNISEINWTDSQQGREILDFNRSSVGLSASFQRRDSLFGIPVFYLASVSGLTNNASMLKKISYLGSAVFTFKQNKNTRFAAGLLLNIDPSVAVPVFPVISYWHEFNHKLELNLSLPSGVSLRKTISDRLWATAGTTLSGSVSFVDLNFPGIPNDVNYTTIDIKTGLGFEYKITKLFVAGINGGILSPISARAFQRNASTKDYFLDNRLGHVPYLNFSFSVLPFERKKK